VIEGLDERNDFFDNMNSSFLCISYSPSHNFIFSYTIPHMQADSDLLTTQLNLEKKATSKDESNYFVEGFELPPEEQAIRDRLLSHIPIIKTKFYRVIP
jgi:hypothetical protein